MPLYITYSLPKKKLEFRSEPNFSTVEKKNKTHLNFLNSTWG